MQPSRLNYRQSYRKNKNRHSNSSSWIVTFADMMALLLTFFIIMASISSTNDDKYRAVANSMEKAFGATQKRGDGQTKEKAQEQKDKSLLVKRNEGNEKKKADYVKPPSVEANPENKSGAEDPSQEKLNVIRMKTVTNLLAKEIQQGTVQVEIKNSAVVMRFPERVAFTSGSDELNNSFDPAISNLIKVLTRLKGVVTISGHTDNRPIDTFRFRSNWELSTARAVSVLHALLSKSDLESGRFTVQGHADTHPIIDNDTAVNRAENRRVEISIQVP